MSDRLASLMAHFPVSAQVFNAGPLCGVNTLESDGTHGQLHLVRSGTNALTRGAALVGHAQSGQHCGPMALLPSLGR